MARWEDLREIELLEEQAGKLRKGRILPDAFRAVRLDQGIYGMRGQPEEGGHIVRVKLPQGDVEPEQLRVLAELAEEMGGGVAHVTTRQGVEIHGPRLEELGPLLRKLAAAGLTTRESAGNTVRNITCCPLAGVCAKEVFDVSPHARALTRHWLRSPMATGLPRKFKVAFSGCEKDCALAPIHDLGVVAVTRGGERGFRLYAGGGLGAQPRRGEVLEEFVPEADLFRACEAVLRAFARHFDQHLDRKNRSRARLKFLLEKIGVEEFRRLVREERAGLNGFSASPLDPPERPPKPPRPQDGPSPLPKTRDCSRWSAFNVAAQKQEGYCAVFVRLPTGDVTAAQLRRLADACHRFSLRCRATDTQGFVLLWVPRPALVDLYRALEPWDLALPGRGKAEDVTACPGASACPSAVTNARALGKVLSEKLAGKFDDLDGITVKVCGCPNSCCRHAVASIALYGASRRVEGREVPHYVLLLGGESGEGKVSFGKPAARIPAKRVPEAVERLLELYRGQKRPGETFREFAERLS